MTRMMMLRQTWTRAGARFTRGAVTVLVIGTALASAACATVSQAPFVWVDQWKETTPPPAYVAKECPRPCRQPKAIRSASDVHAFCEGLHALRFEEFHVLLLNGNHEVTRRVMVSRGTLNQAQVHPREVHRHLPRPRDINSVALAGHASRITAALKNYLSENAQE